MNEDAYQAMPRTGRLAKSLNLRHEALAKRIAPFKKDTVYSYVVDTVKYHERRLYQTGSGPNFQGDMITLCSCKHLMRTARDTASWKGVWIAGFISSKYSSSRSHKLFYLMRVSQAFKSHHELWSSDSIPEETKIAKAAHLDRFGDIYQPKTELGAHYCHRSYLRPCKGHVHHESDLWHKDIKRNALYYGGRPSALLVGDPNSSFLWDKPVVTAPFNLWQGQKKTTLSELFPLSLKL